MPFISLPPSKAHRLFAQGQQDHRVGRLAAAEQSYRAAIALVPDHAQSLYYLGLIGLQTGRNEQAAELMSKAVSVDGRNADWHYNLGLAYERLGRGQDAVAQHNRAIAIQPRHVNAINHLGIAAMHAGHHDEALREFNRALSIDHDHLPTLNSLGVLHSNKGDYDEAAKIFGMIAQHWPHPVAFENLALALMIKGDRDRALQVLVQGLRVAPTPKMRELFVSCATDLVILRHDPALAVFALQAINECWGHPTSLARFAASLVKTAPAIRVAATRVSRDGLKTEGPVLDAVSAVAAEPLLIALLTTTHIPDSALELFLTGLRAALLGAVEADDGEASALSLLAAIARNCFITEYAFAISAQERAAVDRLRDRIVSALQIGARPGPLLLTALAAYMPLHELPGAEKLCSHAWPAPVEDIITQQIREPAEETSLASNMARATPVENQVSLEVQKQYEEHPYPRWTKVPPVTPQLSLEQHVRTALPSAPLVGAIGGPCPDVLIAGCGSGLVVAAVARLLPQARILAIDLSVPSLAHAQRKARGLSLKNVEFAEADLLNIGGIGRTFDFIHATGVLHHLKDPLAGLRSLVSVLRPNGVMSIGLYSQTARAALNEARALIRERGYGATTADIKKFRQDVIHQPDRFQKLLTLGDFYTISTCRDLLFHVQEHCIAIPEIAAMLETNSLRMLGFELPSTVVQAYARRFPQDTTKTDLACWTEFEAEHPDTFRGMYQFWVQPSGIPGSCYPANPN